MFCCTCCCCCICLANETTFTPMTSFSLSSAADANFAMRMVPAYLGVWGVRGGDFKSRFASMIASACMRVRVARATTLPTGSAQRADMVLVSNTCTCHHGLKGCPCGFYNHGPELGRSQPFGCGLLRDLACFLYFYIFLFVFRFLYFFIFIFSVFSITLFFQATSWPLRPSSAQG